MIQGTALTLLLLAISVIFYLIDFFFMFRYDSRRRSGRGWSWDYTLLTVVIAAVLILQPLLLPGLAWHTSHPLGQAIQVTGLLFTLGSFSLHIWARLHLQKFYAERVELQDGHQLIESGPYARLRHPVITSFFLLAIGIFLINPAVTTVLILIYTFWDFIRAARQEEALLSRDLPGYAAYMQRTTRFLPRPRRPRDHTG